MNRIGKIAWNTSFVTIIFFLLHLSALADKISDLRKQLLGKSCTYNVEYNFDLHKPTCHKKNIVWRLLRAGDTGSDFRCLGDAALCLAELNAKEAIPDILIQIESAPDSYNTGDGMVAIRAPLLRSLIAFKDDPRILPVLTKVLASDASTGALQAASEVAEAIGPKAKECESGLIGLIRKEVSTGVSLAAVKALLAQHSTDAEITFRELLAAPRKNYEVTAGLLSLLGKEPEEAKKFSLMIKNLYEDLTQQSKWEKELTSASSVKEAEVLYYTRYWLSMGVDDVAQAAGLPSKEVRAKLPCLGCGGYKAWSDIRSTLLLRESRKTADLSARCGAAAKLAYSSSFGPGMPGFSESVTTIKNPFNDFDATFIAIKLASSNSELALATKEELIALSKDLINFEIWKGRVLTASTKDEKQRLFQGRILLSHYSLISGVVWNLGFRDKVILDALPRNWNGPFKAWEEFGTSQGLDPKTLNVNINCW